MLLHVLSCVSHVPKGFEKENSVLNTYYVKEDFGVLFLEIFARKIDTRVLIIDIFNQDKNLYILLPIEFLLKIS